jgi:hypothetical protein
MRESDVRWAIAVPGRWNGRLDYPWHEQLAGFQAGVLAQVLNPCRLARIRDAETKFGAANVVTSRRRWTR